MANLEQSGNRIPDAWSVIFTFSLIATFYLSKTEDRTEKSLTHAIALGKGTISAKKCWFFAKENADISKIKVVRVLKGVFSETT